MFGLDRRSCLSIFGAVLCLALTPLQSYIWNGEETPPWLLVARSILDAFADWAPTDPYEFYGSFFFLVYVAPLPLVLRVHGLPKHKRSRGELVGFTLTVGALLVAAVADFAAYGGGLGRTDAGFTQLQRSAFGVEGLALITLGLATVVLGAGLVKAGAIPRWAAWLLIVSAPLGVGVAFVVAYVPHGLLLPYSLTWAAIGLSLRAGSVGTEGPSVRRTEAPSP